jgi:hypothetical protein
LEGQVIEILPRFEEVLVDFQHLLDEEWSQLLKDYTVALHDDLEVLKMCIERVGKELERRYDEVLREAISASD